MPWTTMPIPMVWLEAVPPTLVAVALLVLPGLGCALLLGLRGPLAVGAAPAASLALIGASAVLAEQLGIPFGYGPTAAVAGAALVVAALLGVLIRRLVPPTAAAPGSWRRDAPTYAGGLAIAVALLAWRVPESLIAPRNVSQRFDIVFHVNAIRRTLDTGNGSSLSMGVLMGHDKGVLAFYPAGWHDLTALVAQTLPAGPWQIPLAISAVNVALAAVVWPAGALALTRLIAGPRLRVLLLAGVFAAAFTVFPYRLLEWGVVLPYFCGVALAPGVLALVLSALRLARDDRSSWLAALAFGGLAAVGLAFCHPSVAVAVIGLSLPLVGVRIVRWARSRRAAGRGILPPMLVAAVAVVGLWVVTRPRNGFPGWATPHTFPKAAIGFLAASPVGGPIAVAVAGCLAVAVVWIAVRRRDLLWLPISYLLAGALYVVVAGVPRSTFRTAITGPWYEDWYRIAGLLAIPAVPLAALGASFVVDGILALFRRIRASDSASRRRSVVVSALVIVALVPLTQYGVIDHEVGKTNKAYVFDENAILVSPKEVAFMQRVADVVPRGDVVASNPFDGSAELYAFTGVPVLLPHLNYAYSADDLILMRHLSEAASDPRVCAALAREKVRWVLQFGKVLPGYPEAKLSPGIDAVTAGPGFEEVLVDGPRRLYRITACK